MRSSRKGTPRTAFTPNQLTKRLATLLRQPFFWFITFWGHACILAGTAAIHYFEHASNPKLASWLDTLFWSIATVTTVGYGDASPVTTGGKIIGIFMMISGSLFLVSYTALLAGALITPELQAVESEVTELEREFQSTDLQTHLDKKSVDLLREEIQSLKAMIRESRV
ncbi:MAG: ion channel [Oligoflexia bacterium]|nr:ion channel [Oligoflexia bacterium]